MSSSSDLLKSIRESEKGLTLAELLSAHTGIARRTAQRLIAKLIENHQVSAMGEGRARRYFRADNHAQNGTSATTEEGFPFYIPMSADSLDILAYIDQLPKARKPVGYQRESVQALIVEELRRLHEGVLARYGLRPSDYTTWKAVQLGKVLGQGSVDPYHN